MRNWFNQLWQHCLLVADEAATRAIRTGAPWRRGDRPAAALTRPPRVSDLEPRILFSATPIDPAIASTGDETAMVMTVDAESDHATETDQSDATRQIQSLPSEIVIVDSTVDNLDQLLDDLSESDRRFEVFVLDAQRDGIDQITGILEQKRDIDALHVISHGAAGSVRLGATTLNEDALDAYAGQIASWNLALADGGDLLFYGCELAESSSGQRLLESLSALTGTDVGASNDDTGNLARGGDWELEFQTGTLETSIAVSDQFQSNWLGLLAINTYQQNVSGYTGTADTSIDSGNATSNFSSSVDFLVKNDTDDWQSLIEFANIIGASEIPLGSTITSASLQFDVSNTTAGSLSIHQMLQSWDASTVTWANAFGADGIQNDGIEAVVAADDTQPGGGATVTFDVTSSLQAWASGAANYGWFIQSNSADDWKAFTSEKAGQEPLLTVDFTPPAGRRIDGTIWEDVDGDGDVADDGVAAVGVTVSLWDDSTGSVAGEMDAGDTFVTSTVTNASGDYAFTGLAGGTYFTVVDSKTIAPQSGYNPSFGQTDVWAEQTYGTAGSVTFNGSYSYAASAQTLYGGKNAEVSDDASSLLTAEHVTRVDVSLANAAGVDSGFSFNVVSRTGDGDDDLSANRTVQGSLRQFLQNSNAVVGVNASQFAIPTTDSNFNVSGNGEYRIRPTSALPSISDATILDGTTQAGFVSTPIIELNGFSAGAVDGLVLTAGGSGSTIRGLVINQFGASGIWMNGSDNNVIAGNFIGTDVTGMVALGNTADGIAIENSDLNQFGGPKASDRNVISGNQVHGLHLFNGSVDNVIAGNYIGTTRDGLAAIGNQSNGILIADDTSDRNIIGGTSAGEGNVISGNGVSSGWGIDIQSADSTKVHGNIIGSDVRAMVDLGNKSGGVRVKANATLTQIGGSADGKANIIAYNDGEGINLSSGQTKIRRNRIFGNTAANGIMLTGGNGAAVTPVLSAASATDNSVTVTIAIAGASGPNPYRIDLFSNSTGLAEGAVYLGSKRIPSASKVVTFTGITVANGDWLTATAMNINGTPESSDFSAAVSVSGPVSVNTAPVLDPTIAVSMDNVAINAPAPVGVVGTDVATLVDLLGGGGLNNVTDPDGGAVTGIAILETDNTQGTWHYTTDNGATWNPLGTVTETNARLLRADGLSRVYFQPNPGFSGTIEDAIWFHAWDATQPYVASDFKVADYSVDDGTAMWKTSWTETDAAGGGASSGNIQVLTGNDQLQIETNNLNDEIVRTVDLSGASTATLWMDVNNTLAGAGRIVVEINGGSGWTVLKTFDSGNTGDTSHTAAIPVGDLTANAQLRFRVDGVQATEKIKVDDVSIHFDGLNVGGGTADLAVTGGTSPFSMLSNSAAITVQTGVPTADAGGPYTIAEGQSLVLDASGSSDPDGDPLTYRWDLDGDGLYDDAVGVAPTVSWAALGAMDLPINDDGTRTIAVEVDDGNGGVHAASVSLTVTNTIPVLTVGGTGTVGENATYSITLSAADPGNDTVTSWYVDWGDGSYETFSAPLPATYDHVYTRGGTYQILVAAVDEDGTWLQNDLIVPDYTSPAQVIRLDANDGSQVNQFGSVGVFDSAVQAVVGPNGNLFVSAYWSSEIREFTPGGAEVGVFSNGVNGPTGMAFDANGNLWVAGHTNKKLVQLDGAGSVVQSLGVGFRPTGMQWHSNGKLYLLGYDTGQLYEYDGVSVTSIASGLINPESLAVGSDGNLYVADRGNQTIKIFDTLGTLVDSFVVEDAPLATFDPYGIAFGADGLMYVSSYTGVGISNASDRIARFRFNGTDWVYLDEFSHGGMPGVNLDGPGYMTFLPEHLVSVVDAADPPTVTAASTSEGNQTTNGLVITRNIADGNEVTHFKITGITGGTLYQNDGVTPIVDGTFITVAQGNAGLRFTPTGDLNDLVTTFGFGVEASLSNSDTGLGGGVVAASISVSEINDAPVRTAGIVSNLVVNEDSTLTSLGLGGLGYDPGGAADETSQTLTYTVTAVPSAALGTIYLADGTTPVTTGTYSLTDLQGMQFLPTSQANGGPATFQWTVTDDGPTNSVADPKTLTESLTITVTAQPDLPVIGGTGDSAINDTTTVTPFASVTIDDYDGDNVTTTVTLSSGDANGTFTAASLSASGFVKSGTGQYTLSSTTTALAQSAIRSLVFAPTANQVAAGSTVTTTFTIGVTDGGPVQTDGTTDVTVTSVNDAPSIGSSTLTSITQGDPNPPGATIASLVGPTFTDADAASSLSGIVVVVNTANPVTEGRWQYSSDGGTTWADIGSVDDATNGLAIAASSYVRFLPVATFSGTPTSIQVRGLDDSYAGSFSTTNPSETRQVFATGSPSATSPFSDPSQAIGTTVSASNAPVIGGTVGGQSVDDDKTRFVFSGVTITDPDLDAVSVTVTLSGGDTNGGFTAASLVTSGFTKTGAGQYSLTPRAPALAEAAVRLLEFAPQLNQVAAGNTVLTTFTISVNDGTSTVNDNATTVSALSINDAPGVGNAILAPVLEDAVNPAGDLVSNLFGPSFTDVDFASSLQGIAVVGNSANPTSQGRWQYSSDGGTTWADVGTVNDTGNGLAIASTSRIRFLPAANFNGTPNDLTIRALDDSYGGTFSNSATAVRVQVNTFPTLATSPFSTNTANVSTSVTPVNDPPTLASTTLTMVTGSTLNQSPGLFNALSNDVDGDALTAQFVVATSQGTLVGNPDGSFTYTPNDGFVGTDSFQWRADDGTVASPNAVVTIEVKPLLVPVVTTPDPIVEPPPDPVIEPEPEPEPEPDPEPEPVSESGGDGESEPTTGTPSETHSEPPLVVAPIATPSTTADGNHATGSDNDLPDTESIIGGMWTTISSSSPDASRDARTFEASATGGYEASEFLMRDSLTGALHRLDLTLMTQSGAMWQEMDAQRHLIESRVQSDIIVVGAAGAAASTFTVGYVAWAIRSGFILSGVLAQMPAWQAIDPLTIMQNLSAAKRSETLEELMERKAKQLKPNRTT